MFTPIDVPTNTPLSQFNANVVGKVLYSILFGRRNGSWQQAAFADTAKTALQLALASGSSVTVWTPAAGNVIQLTFLAIMTSVASEFDVQVNGVTILYAYTQVGVTLVLVNCHPGFFCYPANGVLTVKNNSGSPSDIRVSALGAEVLA